MPLTPSRLRLRLREFEDFILLGRVEEKLDPRKVGIAQVGLIASLEIRPERRSARRLSGTWHSPLTKVYLNAPCPKLIDWGRTAAMKSAGIDTGAIRLRVRVANLVR